MSVPSIGTIRGTIEIDYDGKGIIRAQDDTEGLKKKGEVTTAQLDKMARNLALFGGVIAGGFAVATNSAISFEKRLSAIEAVSGATAAQMDQLSKKALQLGADTKFSAGEAALAMEELVKAGLSVEEVLGGAADATVALAAAGEVDLPFAAQIASNALNQFNLKASDLNRVVDNIAGAANASAIDVKEFGFSLSQVGAVAHLAGQSFEDTATAIALMGNAGIKGSDAGTSLKTFLNNLIPTTDRAKQTFKDLGLAVGASGNAFIDAQGNYKSLTDIAGVLHQATVGLSESQKTLALETLFGSDAIRAAAIISNAGAEGFKNLNAEMNKSTAAEVAATRMNNTAGSIEQLKGSAETLAISIGQIFLPAVNSMVKEVTTWVNAFGALDKGTQKTIVTVIGAIGAFALAAAAVVKVVQAIKAVQTALAIIKAWEIATKLATAAQWLWNIALSANPIGLIIIAVAALIGGLILLFKHNEKFRKVVLAVWAAIQKAVKAVVDWFMAYVWPTLKVVIDAVVEGFKWLWGWVVKIFRFIVEGVKFYIGIWVSIFKFIAPVVKAAFDLVVSVIKTAWTIISAVLSVIIAVVKFVFGLWWSITSEIMGAILGLIKFVWGFIGPFIIGAIKLWWDYIQGVWNGLVKVTTFVFNLIKDVITAVWGFIGPYVIGTAKALWDGVVALFTWARDRVVAIIEGVKIIVDKIRNFFGELKAAADKGVGPLIEFVKGIPGKIFGAIGNIGSLLYDSGRKMIQGLIDGIKSMANKAKDTLSDLLSGLRRLLPFSPAKEGPFSGKGWTFNSGTALIEDFAKGVDRASAVSLDSLMGAVSGVASSFEVGSTPGATSTTTTHVAGSVNIASLNVSGIWDFTDPMATRNMVSKIDQELTLYKNGYR